jgi:hypothetical protein
MPQIQTRTGSIPVVESGEIRRVATAWSGLFEILATPGWTATTASTGLGYKHVYIDDYGPGFGPNA